MIVCSMILVKFFLTFLSNITMIMTPAKSTGTLEKMQLLSLNPFQAVLVIVTDVGLVHHRTIDFPIPVSEKRLEEIIRRC